MDVYEGAQHINVGTGVDLTIRELAETVRDVVYPEGELVFDTSQARRRAAQAARRERINALGWKAKIGLREGIESTYAWFLEHSRAPVATP